MAFPRHLPGSSVEPSPSFPEIEHRVLAGWKEGNTFQKSIDQREGCDEWVFYDGPPFANGLPHYGHLLTGYAKDVFPRFHTMRGKQVHRRFGWDTHGLPAELEAERNWALRTRAKSKRWVLPPSTRPPKNRCPALHRRVARVCHPAGPLGGLRQRLQDTRHHVHGERHLGFSSSCTTKGLAYEGYRVLPYCWRDQTPLSNHELRMDDDVYKPRQDQSVTVTFPLHGEKAEQADLEGVLALAWTTTPWTLPTNAALAVGPEISYALVPAGPEASTAWCHLPAG
jgi:isoleucyl-tRNA synthetase